MTLVSFAQEKKQSKLVFILIALILITAGILFFVLKRPVPSQFSPAEAEIDRVIKKINFDADFLEQDSFKALRVYGQWPLVISEKGRTNPFLSY